ncbi:MAG: phosphate ABC transporter permease subunit PstC [Solirubrobacterales bacterium]|nr:phosphate ABC transporter permease subunit PstC [Solirubrobacterales bacterium]
MGAGGAGGALRAWWRPVGSRQSSRRRDRVGDVALRTASTVAAVLGVVLIGVIAYQILHGAGESISKFGPGFLFHSRWQPNFGVFGAGVFLFGTVVSSLFALVLAVPLAISIGLFLATVAPSGVRRVIGPLVEMLAAIPSVILGFWGIVVLAPFVQAHLEPALNGALGWLPIFGTPSTTGTGIFTASLILTIMVVPIIASVSRDLFLAVPRELREGATALGATRWEVVRGILLPSTFSGLVAASFLGLGRALGEAIATTQVIGAGTAIHASLFAPGNTLAAGIADEYFSATSKLHVSSLFYLGAILLAIGLLANLAAQRIVRRFDVYNLALK